MPKRATYVVCPTCTTSKTQMWIYHSKLEKSPGECCFGCGREWASITSAGTTKQGNRGRSRNRTPQRWTGSRPRSTSKGGRREPASKAPAKAEDNHAAVGTHFASLLQQGLDIDQIAEQYKKEKAQQQTEARPAGPMSDPDLKRLIAKQEQLEDMAKRKASILVRENDKVLRAQAEQEKAKQAFQEVARNLAAVKKEVEKGHLEIAKALGQHPPRKPVADSFPADLLEKVPEANKAEALQAINKLKETENHIDSKRLEAEKVARQEWEQHQKELETWLAFVHARISDTTKKPDEAKPEANEETPPTVTATGPAGEEAPLAKKGRFPGTNSMEVEGDTGEAADAVPTNTANTNTKENRQTRVQDMVANELKRLAEAAAEDDL